MLNRILLILLFTLLLNQAPAQSIIEINEKSCNSYKAADKDLNEVYRQVLRERADDTNFVNALKASERAWLAFRDAQIKAIYPDPDPPMYPNPDPLIVYGRMHPACVCSALEAMTRERAKELRARWIDGTSEDDACGGSSPRRTRVRNRPKNE